MQNLKKHKKEKNDTICEHTYANCSCQNVHFFCFILFFLQFPKCSEMFFDRFQKIKNNNISKQQKQKTTTIENKMQNNNK